MKNVYGRSANKPFELIGFNTCLSASYELANSISDFSRYMVGSEPSENGWYFKEWIAALANNPAMNGAQIGKIICDSNMKSYTGAVKDHGGTEQVNAFSVIDLSKMPELREAYEKYFKEAKRLADKQKGFSGAFARAASSRTTEKYTNLYMDLGTLAENTKEILPEVSKDLLTAIKHTVVYNHAGAYLQAHGISTYYPYISTNNSTLSENDFEKFLSQKSTPKAQKNLYKKLLKLDASKLKDLSVEQNSRGNFVVKLSPEQLENISMVRCMILPYIEFGDESVGLEDEGFVVLPSDIDLKIDWNSGTFTDNFLGLWPTIDGHKICMELSNEGPLRDFYEVPILLSYKETLGVNAQGKKVYKEHENEPVVLQVAYDFATKSYVIVGVGSDVENGMVRHLDIQLRPGDTITPLFFTAIANDSLDADGENVIKYTDPETGESTLFKATRGESFKYTKNSRIIHQPFEEGVYIYYFQFFAPNGSSIGVGPCFVKVDEDGTITKKILTLEQIMSIEDVTDLEILMEE